MKKFEYPLRVFSPKALQKYTLHYPLYIGQGLGTNKKEDKNKKHLNSLQWIGPNKPRKIQGINKRLKHKMHVN